MITVVSDVHIKTPGDKPSKLFMSFLTNPLVNRSEKVILLGDIFDFVVGGDIDFVNEFQEIFDGIRDLLKDGKEVYYIEGNHDFHIGKLLKKTFPENNFIFSKEKIQLTHEEINIVFCHGDDIEIDNPSYKRYAKIIRSWPIQILAEWIVPFSFTRMIGNWASAKSRKKNIAQYESKSELIKTKFRNSAETAFRVSPCQIIISGHSHVKDKFESELGFIYANNGYFPNEKSFISIEKDHVQFNELAEPSR
ncbi:MAG: UDP-2,3-diacylglucosamine hydrolase [Bacteriovoracaceae bacterium]|jgi:UDP-2,3-diacylglucosamine hydrolase